MTRPETTTAYRVQYTDDAEKQMAELADEVQKRVRSEIRAAATVNPRTHGRPEAGIPDRVRIPMEGASVLVWLSENLRILTVIQVGAEGTPVSKPVNFGTEEDQIDLHPRCASSTVPSAPPV